MKHFLYYMISLVIPVYALHAQTVTTPTDLKGFVNSIIGIINLLVPLLFGLIFLTISWGVIKAWVMGDATEDDVEKGKKIALVGVIVLTVLSAFWGILNLLKTGFFG